MTDGTRKIFAAFGAIKFFGVFSQVWERVSAQHLGRFDEIANGQGVDGFLHRLMTEVVREI